MITLAIDCGGSFIKGSVLDESGTTRAHQVRIETPYPLSPERFVGTLLDIGRQLPSADRVTVGMPGMIRHGVVIHTPHYINVRGPFTRRDPVLADAWGGFDVRTALREAFGMPALVLNDAEVHGAGVVTGAGLELVLTLGTGLGCAMFDGGVLAPHIELSHAPVRAATTYDEWIGDAEHRRIGDLFWSRRVRVMVERLRPVFHWDRLYLGGGNSRLIKPELVRRMGDDVVIVPNSAGIIGGVRAWQMHMPD